MERISQMWHELVQNGQTWIVEIFVIVVLTLFANYFAVKFLNHLKVQLLRTSNLWDDALVESASKPLAYLIWLVGFAWAAEIVDQHSGTTILVVVGILREVLVIALLAWFIVRFIKQVEFNLIEDSKTEEHLDATTIMAIARLFRAAVIITTVLVVLQSLGYSVEGVMAFGGIGGIAIGFAAKDLLANFFGGLMIYMDRPFTHGDWIRSPDKKIEGTVESIGWRLTCIRTFDKRPLYVPNSVFANIAVENPSRMTNRRIYETIGLRYDDVAQVRSVIDDVKKMLIAHPEIDNTQTLIVNFNAFGASSLDFFVYTFTKTTEWVYFHKIKEDVLLKILDIIIAHGADVAYPTSTIKTPDLLQISQQEKSLQES